MPTEETNRILVTGAAGQIGCALVVALRRRYGECNVIATDIRADQCQDIQAPGPFAYADVTQAETIEHLVETCRIDTIYHLAAILSATGEKHPQRCWQVNINGLVNILEIARQKKLRRVVAPSSMAVFGPTTPRQNTPQDTSLRPTTMYGITKVAGELLCAYYYDHYGVDARGIRYPGIISSEAPPGGGTTDYAVDIFYEALKCNRYTCFLKAGTVLPMIYMPDVIRGTIQLAEADSARLSRRAEYNMAGFSISPCQLAAEIQQHIPEFEIEYAPDYRQAIAESWPTSIDDSVARAEWDWAPQYDLHTMTQDMLEKLEAQQSRSPS